MTLDALRVRRSVAAISAGVLALTAAPASAEPAGASPEDAQALARLYAFPAYGWHYGPQWDCLAELWQHESGWRYDAANPKSSAHGIPQALTELHGLDADWQADPLAQISWGLAYIADRYGNPCTAWETWKSRATQRKDGTFHGGWY